MVELAGWSDVLLYLSVTRRRFQATADEAAVVHLPHEGGATEVHLQRTRAPSGSVWLALAIALGPVVELRLRPALVANLELPFGALAIWRDQAALRQALPLGGLLVAHFDEALLGLCRVARELRSATPGRFAYVFRELTTTR